MCCTNTVLSHHLQQQQYCTGRKSTALFLGVREKEKERERERERERKRERKREREVNIILTYRYICAAGSSR
jgi:hypothetical protein